MTDIELTELAAKAFGDAPDGFSPLTNDGDALRLAVKLCIDIKPPRSEDDDAQARQVEQSAGAFESQRKHGPYVATRRAIVRAAAEIGKTA
jgi:hypothetical protein